MRALGAQLWRTQGGANKRMTPVGFEPTQLALVELESTPLDHSGKVSLEVVPQRCPVSSRRSAREIQLAHSSVSAITTQEDRRSHVERINFSDLWAAALSLYSHFPVTRTLAHPSPSEAARAVAPAL